MNTKEIRENINEYLDAKIQEAYYGEKIKEVAQKIETKLYSLFFPLENPKLSDIDYWQGEIRFVYPDSDETVPLSNYKEWGQEEKNLIKPALIEVLLFFKLRKEYLKWCSKAKTLEPAFKYATLQKPENFNQRNPEPRDFLHLMIGCVLGNKKSDFEIAKKDLEGMSDEELLKGWNSTYYGH